MGVSAGSERERLGNFLSGLVICSLTAMRAAGATFLGAGAQRIVDDGLDRACAAAALGAATETPVNLLGISRQVRSCTHSITDIIVAQDVAGTDDHETKRTFGDATSSIWKSAKRCKGKNRIFKQFQSDTQDILE
jgi:hypothetical protein